jgi:hypothetical protein
MLRVFDGDADTGAIEWDIEIPQPGRYLGRAWTHEAWRALPRNQRPKHAGRVAQYHVVYEYLGPLS